MSEDNQINSSSRLGTFPRGHELGHAGSRFSHTGGVEQVRRGDAGFGGGNEERKNPGQG